MTLSLDVDVRGRRVVVVGGGDAAATAAARAVEAGAEVLVVAPDLGDELAALALDGALTWRPRPWAVDDLVAAWLVHAATDEPRADAEVAAAAARARVWCVVASAGAAAPAVTQAPLASTTAAGTSAAPGRRGSVALVGGGPGDAELLTVRARRLLAEADVVVVDRLAPREVLADLDPHVQVIDVGKTPDHHPVPQHEINRLLVEHARAGARVVRLKGGDPFLLGRGGEEWLACTEAGVEVSVVPGVTSAFSVPAAAGIPVTHRGLSRSVTVVTGHEDLTPERAGALVALGGTLVVLMGVATLDQLVDRLLAAGADPSTPVAAVERGWTPRQRTVRARLADAVATMGAAGVRSPAVIVVGAVAGLDLLAAAHVSEPPG
ncbi:MAG: uroporphyrinogen-III C-methyltransferase [Kineosporiaceae bacterium]